MLKKLKSHKNILIILVVCSFVLFFKLGSYAVIESSEARYAEIGRAMFLSDDYIHPNLMGVQHYHKPPITYQITALGYKLFGVNPFGARFFLQIALLIQLFLVYKLTWALTKEKTTAIWASLIYFSFPIVIISVRNLTTDAYLNTSALLAMYFWVVYKSTSKVRYLYAFTLSLALGFLTKGPVIFIVPIVFVLFYNNYIQAKIRFSIHHLFSWLLFFGIGFSWYAYLYIENNHFLDYFIGNQTLDRFAKSDFGRTEPFWYFIIATPILGLPWFIFLGKKGIKIFHKTRSKSLEFVLGSSILIPLVFFSLSSSKRILYILPFYSLAAILIAVYLNKTIITKKFQRIIYSFPLLFLGGLSIVPFLNLPLFIPKFISLLGIAGIILVTSIIFYKKANIKTKLILNNFIGMCILIVSFTILSSNNKTTENPTKNITDFIIQKQLNQRPILIFNRFKPSISFNLNKPVIALNNGYKSLERDTQFEKDTTWKDFFINLKNPDEMEYLNKLMSKPSVLVILTKESKEESLNWLITAYSNVKTINKWQVYY